jgi:uncharacterized protein (TIGR03435 family)
MLIARISDAHALDRRAADDLSSRNVDETTVGDGNHDLEPVTIYSWIKAGSFPAPVKLGPRSVAWLKKEVDAWVTIFTALEEQLGLKLQPAEGKIEHFIIRSAQRPAEN